MNNENESWKTYLIYLQKSVATIGVGNANTLQTLILIATDTGIALFRDVIELRMV